MANVIKVKRSSVAGKVPVTGDLQLGELAINTYDGKLYLKKDNGTESIVTVNSGGAGTGDVVGPASATDNAIARYDGTTGKLIQNSLITIDDDGDLANINSLGFDTTPTAAPTTEGTVFWDDGDGVPSAILKGALTTLQIGTQEYARVYNDSGSTLTRGQVVYISGAQGNRVAVKLARADVEATSFGTIGLVAETIANGAEGFIIVSGALYKLNTTGLTAGAAVYLSPTTAGAYTTTKPQAPDQLVILGWIERISATVGSIYVKIDNGYELDELHDVLITTPSSGNTLIYDATASVWKNASLTQGTGITVTNGAGSITVANAGVTSLTGTANQVSVSASTGAVTLSLPATINVNTTGTASNVTGTVAVANGGTGQTTYTDGQLLIGNTTGNTLTKATLTAGSGISVTNGAGSITIAATNAGTVTSVTATSPVQSTGGTTPVISLASAYGDTLNPYGSKTANFFLAAPNGTAGAPTFRAIVAADIPTLNQNTTGTAANVTGTVAVANGGTGATTQAGARTGLGATTVGANLFTLTNPSAVTFPRFNADNTVSALDAATFRTAIGAGTGSGTVTSVGGTGTVSGLTLTGTVTSSGNLTLGGNLTIAADMIYDNFTATASQTTFTTSQTYTSGKIQVFVNGCLMVNGADVTVTSGTSVVFATGLTVGDRVTAVYPI